MLFFQRRVLFSPFVLPLVHWGIMAVFSDGYVIPSNDHKVEVAEVASAFHVL